MTQPPHAPTGGLLVIGYGNSLRSDDGVGPEVASSLAAANLPGVRSIACHQLTPELAEAVSRAESVVFVDAAVDATTLEWQDLEPAQAGRTLAHAADPRMLLALARDVFGRCPPARWLKIPVAVMEFGDGLSPRALDGVRQAVAKIHALAERGAGSCADALPAHGKKS